MNVNQSLLKSNEHYIKISCFVWTKRKVYLQLQSASTLSSIALGIISDFLGSVKFQASAFLCSSIMDNCVSLSISSDQSMKKICQWLDIQVGYVHNLEKNLSALEKTMEELRAKLDDLSRRVTREEDRGLQRLSEFQVWLTRVETFENEANNLLIAGNGQLQRLCLLGFCSKSLILSYRYGKSVSMTLREVEKLNSKVFEVIVEQAHTFEVEERQLQSTIVGLKEMLENAWNHLMEDRVGIMGFYGMGGVGKTTLITQLNNKFSGMTCGFDFVIWVVVSKELQVEKIQSEIARKVGLDGDEWKQKEKSQKAKKLMLYTIS